MQIIINGQSQTVDARCSVKQLLEQLSLSDKRIAVEVNQSIIPRSQHDNYFISDGDHVEIVNAIGGG